MRLRHLRRLEEQALLKEQRRAQGRAAGAQGAADATRARRRATAAGGDRGDRRAGSAAARSAARRTALGEAPVIDGRGARGAGRAPAGHRGLLAPGLDPRAARPRRGRRGAEVQGGRRARASCCTAQSTDRLLLISSDGRGYLLPVERLPGGRGQGEPLRLQIDLGARRRAGRCCAVHRPDGRRAARLQRGARLRRRGAGDRGADPGRQAGVQSRRRASGWWSPARRRATTWPRSAATASC